MRVGVSLSLIIFVGVCIAQDFSSQLPFINHLNKLKAYDEAIYLLDSLDQTSPNDTIKYHLGKFNYYKKNIQQSIAAFDQVSLSSPFFEESVLMSIYQSIYIGNYDLLYSRRTDLSVSKLSTKGQQIINFDMAGISLLERNLKDFEKHQSQFNSTYFQLVQSQDQLVQFHRQIENFNPKSRFLAGLYSTIIPGAGKIYIGKTGEGLMSMLTTVIFGVQAWEAYRKDGIQSARFIIFGGLFSSFYVANIWGSVLAVNIRENEFNEQINQSILVSLHIPLRLLYD